MAEQKEEQAETKAEEPPPEAPKEAKKAAKPDKKAKKGKKAPDGADTSGLGSVVVRNEYYRDGYRSLLRLAFIQGVAIIGLLGAVYFIVHSHQPENRYFATTEDGRLIPMLALNQPNLSTPALLSWVAQAATEVMTFGFNDYRRRLQESSRSFTKPGWESFTKALQASRIIETVETNQQVVTAAPSGAPIVESEGLFNGRYQWIIQLPLIVTYQSGTKTRSNRLLVTLVVVRVPRLESPNGIGIEQWIAVPG